MSRRRSPWVLLAVLVLLAAACGDDDSSEEADADDGGSTTTTAPVEDNGWVEHVRQTAEQAGDRCWPMPLYEEYFEQLRSEIADMINSGGRPAGACTAAVFLKEFAAAVPWAHLDVAGTAWAEEAKPWQPKGPSGVAVRTLAELAFTTLPEWGPPAGTPV